MGQLLSPGTRTTQLVSGPVAPPNIATAVAGMLCYTQWGPVGVPMAIVSTTSAAQIFGGRITSPGSGRMTDSLVDFYNSGGGSVYIMRYVGSGAAAGARTLNTTGAASAGSESSNANSFPTGMAAGATFIGIVDGGSPITATIHATPATVTGVSGTFSAVTAAHTLVINVVGVAGNQTVTFAGTESTAALFAAAITTQVRGASAFVSSTQVKIVTTREGSSAAGSIVSGSSDVLASLGMTVGAFTNAGTNNVANVDAVTAVEYVAIVNPLFTGSTTVANTNNSVTWTSATTGGSSSVQFSGGTGVAFVAGFDNAIHSGGASSQVGTATLTAAIGPHTSPGSYINLWGSQVTSVNMTVATATTIAAGSIASFAISTTKRLAIGDQISIAKSSDTQRGVIQLINGNVITLVAPITVPSGGYTSAQSVVLETWNLTVFDQNGAQVVPSPFTGLRMSPLSANYFVTVLNSASLTPVLSADLTPSIASGDARPVTDANPVLFTGGADGAAPVASDVIALVPNWDQAPDLNFFATPGCCTDFGATFGASILLEEEAYANNRGDVISIMAAAKGTSYTDMITFVQQTANLASSLEAIYWPWVLRLDSVSNAIIPFPPEPFILGAIARTAQNANYAQAPAGTTYGQLPTAQGAEIAIGMQSAQYNALYPALINAILPLAGYGTCIFGSRTLDPTGEFGQISIQTVFNVAKRTINLITLPYVFAGANQTTWSAITTVVTAFFRQMFKAGILQGATEAEAFFVTCNSTNNTKEVVDADMIVGKFGIAPERPGEFLEFTLQLIS